MQKKARMGKRVLSVAAAAVLAVGCVAIPLPAPQAEPDTLLPYQDTTLSFEERAADLVSRMTLEEKASQLGNRTSAISRLGVASYDYWTEALHGVARLGEATSFPYSIAMAASWDPDMIQEITDAVSDEARGYSNGKGQGLSYWSPTINMARDPRWGRNHESYGEDPFLTTQIGSGFVKGMQGDDEKYLKTIATVKHYAANNSEYNRHTGDSQMDDRTLREYYTRAFKGVVREADVASAMSSYNRVNGIPASANTYLLDTLLRKTFGFDGYVTSDCGAIQDITENHKWAPEELGRVVTKEESVAYSLMAGCDLDCGSIYPTYAENAVNTGVLSEDVIDQALLRLFTARMQTGEFDPAEDVPYRSETYSFDNQVENAEHKQLAEDSANDTIVLLKNEAANGESDPILPLDISAGKNIVMVGGIADEVVLGGYSGTPSEENTSTPIQGMEALGANVTYIEGAATAPAGSYICNMRNVIIHKKDGTTVTLKPSDAKELVGCRYEAGSGNIGYITPGATLMYENVDVKNIDSISFEVAGDTSVLPGTITVTMDSLSGMQFASVKTESTGGWQTYKELTYKVTDAGGYSTQDLYFSFSMEYQNVTFTDEETQQIQNADTVIVCLEGNTSGEGTDRSTIVMPSGQISLINTLAQLNPRTVVYLQTVGAVELGDFMDNVPAILWTCYNGQAQGNAMARVICGEVNPTAKLPFTWYAQNAALPTIDDYDIRGGEDYAGWTYQYYDGPVTYPFGYGLSYSSYEYSNLKITSSTTVTPNDTLTATVDVKNTSDVDGEEIVQLYVAVPNPDGVNRPFKQLKSFEKVAIAAGETKTVTLTLDLSDCYFWDEEEGRNVYDQGEYTLFVGPSSDEEDAQMQTATFTMDGELTPELTVVTATADKVVLNAANQDKVITTEVTATMNDDSFYDLENGDATVTFESDDPTVATVDENGVVRAVGSGVTTITATVKIGDVTMSDSFPVAVQVEVEEILIDGEPLADFESNITEYYYPVEGSTVPTVTVPGVPSESLTIQNATSIPGDTVVTLSMGGVSSTYTIHFTTRSTDYVVARFSAAEGEYTVENKTTFAINWQNIDGDPVDLTTHPLGDLHLRMVLTLEQTGDTVIDDASAYRSGYIKLRSADTDGKENSAGWYVGNLGLKTGVNYVDIPINSSPDTRTGTLDWRTVGRINMYIDSLNNYDGPFNIKLENVMIVDAGLDPVREELWTLVNDDVDESLYTMNTLVPYQQAKEAIRALIFKDGEVSEQEADAAIEAYNTAKAALREDTYLVGTFSKSSGTYTVLYEGTKPESHYTLYNDWKDGDSVPFNLDRDRSNLRLQMTVQFNSDNPNIKPEDVWGKLTIKLRSSDEAGRDGNPNNSEHNYGWDFTSNPNDGTLPYLSTPDGTAQISIDLSSEATNSKGLIDWADIRRLIVLADLSTAARNDPAIFTQYSMTISDVKIVDLTNIFAEKEQIQELIDETVNTSGIDEELVTAYTEAKAEAEAVCATEMATPEQVYYAHVALQDAIQAIKDAGGDTPDVDKAALNALIAQAQQVDAALYTDATARALETALQAAEEVAGDDAATQTQVDDARTALQAALDALQMAWGDIDATAGVSASDALMALQAATGKVDLTAAQQTLANVDGEGEVTASDALMILQRATQKIASFPVENNA